MFWFRTNSRTGNLFSAGRIENDSVTAGFALRLENGQIVLYSEAEKRICDMNVSDDAWHHLALSVNRTYNSVSVFIDDEMTDNFSSDLLGPISGKMYLGGFDGYVDEFAIFEQALPKTLIEDFYRITPYGDEMGLMAFLPFEKMQENNNAIIELVYSPNDERVFKDSEGNILNKVLPLILTADARNYADKTTHAPVCSRGMLTKMNFTWTFDNTELLLNLKMADREVNKQNIYITVRDVEDLNGNPMVSPVTWTAFVDHNSLKWSEKSLTITSEFDADNNNGTTSLRIINNSGKRHIYQIESLPAWLTVDRMTGAIDPMGEQTVKLTYNTQLAVGEYSDIIYLTDEDGLSEPLQIDYTVEAFPPYGDIDTHLYPFNMSICAKVMVVTQTGTTYDTDERDIVYAIYHNECIGKANVTYNDAANTSDVFLTVFGSDDMYRKELSFQLWQASTGTLYNLVSNRNITFAHGYVCGCGDDSPVVFTTAGSETQNIEINAGWNWISTNLNLQPEKALLNQVMTAAEPWTEGDLIKNPATRKFSTYSETQDAFTGSLSAWDYKQMYMVYAANDNIMRLSGEQLTEADKQITLHGDGQWNPLPCLFEQNTPVTEAMAGYFNDANPGDLLKAHNRFAVFSSDKRWVGDLTALRPGEGYLMRRMGTGSVTVNFYDQTSNAPKRASLSEASPLASFSNPKASTNMTMIARLENEKMEKWENEKIRVYVNNELAAVAVPLSLEGEELCSIERPVDGRRTSGERFYFITIQSDKVGDLRFELEDGTILTPLSTEGASPLINSSLTYTPNAHHGSLKAPIMLKPTNERPYKIIEDNHVVIIRNNEKYSITGTKLQ